MDTNLASLELLPVDGKDEKTPPAANTRPAAGAPASGADAKNVDKYLAAATAEYEGGHIEQALWDRAVSQSNGDRDLAINTYLRTRAIALRVLKREARPFRPAVTASDDPDAPRQATVLSEAARGRRRRAKIKVYALSSAGAACVGAIAWFALPYVAASEAPKPAPAQVVKRAADTAPATAEQKAQTGSVASVAELNTKIDQLKDAGNWHVLVLYASELTRLQPNNPVAWNQLSQGYQRLQQYDEAFEAANRAVALAPDNASYWRDVAQLQLQLNQPEKALHSFEEAVARDNNDTQSVIQSGVLYFQLARMAEAKAALEKGLASNPDDSNVQCLKSLIARQEAAGREAVAVARQSRMIDGNCSEAKDRQDRVALAGTDGESKSVVVARKRH